MLGMSPRTSCKDAFKELGLLTDPSLFIYESVCYIKTQKLTPTFINHPYNTRRKGTHAVQHKLTIFEHKPDYIGMKLFQALPEQLQVIDSIHKFKSEIKKYLVESNLYNLDNFLNAA